MIQSTESLPSKTFWSGRTSYHLPTNYHAPPAMLRAFHIICHLKPPQQPYKVGTTIIPILQMGKLRLGKITVICPRSQS